MVKCYILSLVTICSLTFVFEKAGWVNGLIIFYGAIIIVPINVVSIFCAKAVKSIKRFTTNTYYIVLESTFLLFLYSFVKDIMSIYSEVSKDSLINDIAYIVISLFILHLLFYILVRSYIKINELSMNFQYWHFKKMAFFIAIIGVIVWCTFFSFLFGYFLKASLYDQRTNIPGSYYYVEGGEIKTFSDSVFSDTIDNNPHTEYCIYDYLEGKEWNNRIGIVNNPYMAYKIAMEALDNKYGYAKVNKENPYLISLSPDKRYWIVEGTNSYNELGGGFSIVIKRDNGAIVYY